MDLYGREVNSEKEPDEQSHGLPERSQEESEMSHHTFQIINRNGMTVTYCQ